MCIRDSLETDELIFYMVSKARQPERIAELPSIYPKNIFHNVQKSCITEHAYMGRGTIFQGKYQKAASHRLGSGP